MRHSFNGSKTVGVTLELCNKTATRLGEAGWLTFAPAAASKYEVDKLGSWTDPLDTVDGGGKSLHGLTEGVRVTGGPFAWRFLLLFQGIFELTLPLSLSSLSLSRALSLSLSRRVRHDKTQLLGRPCLCGRWTPPWCASTSLCRPQLRSSTSRI